MCALDAAKGRGSQGVRGKPPSLSSASGALLPVPPAARGPGRGCEAPVGASGPGQAHLPWVVGRSQVSEQSARLHAGVGGGRWCF